MNNQHQNELILGFDTKYMKTDNFINRFFYKEEGVLKSWVHIALNMIMFTSIAVLFLVLQSVYRQESFVFDKVNIFQIVLIVFLLGLSVLTHLLSRRYSYSTSDFIKLVLNKGGNLYEISTDIIIDEGFKKKLELFTPPKLKQFAEWSLRLNKYRFLAIRTSGAKIGCLLIHARNEGHYPKLLSLHWDWGEDNYEDIIRHTNVFSEDRIKGTIISIFSLGNYSRFASMKLDIYPSKHNETGNSILDQALHETLVRLKGENEVMTLQIRDKWLRVKIRGGPWLGGKFGRRISETIEFTELLVKLLSLHVKPYDLDKWTIDFIGYDYRVRQIESSEQTSTDQKPS